ncbi:MAG: putative transcriptional regulator [Parcubacteria bacterium C7867-004]|nr:MAG: putative transcriptional regulator [Parcubacteria bacterium C7867-004]
MKESITNTVYQHRSVRGVTQEEFADAVGVSRQTVIAIEKGNYAPSVALALRIARYFKVPVETLFSLRHHA